MTTEKLSDRLRLARGKMGLSQSALARRVGISPQAIQALESGVAAGSKYLPMIAGVLGVEAIWLQKGESEPFRANHVEMTLPLQAEDSVSGITRKRKTLATSQSSILKISSIANNLARRRP